MKKLQLTAVLSLLLSTTLFSQGTVSTIVDTSAFRFTDDLILDINGNLFCSDYSGDAVYKMTPSGDVSVFADSMNTPNGLAFDSGGNLFVCDNIGNAIYKINSNGDFLDTFQVTGPSGIIKDALSDTMIFTTYGTSSDLRKLAPNGTVSNFHSGSPLNGPVGLEYCQGNLYVANFSNREIYRVESDTLIFIAQLPGSGSLGFLTVVGDYLMATAFNNHKIYTIDPVAQTVDLYSGGSAGHINGPVTSALFTTPNGIVANPSGDTIYVSEYNSRRLRMITNFTAEISEPAIDISYTLYPNPATELIRLELETDQPSYSLSIFDLQGKQLIEMNDLTQSTVSVNISELRAGTYNLVIETESAVSKSKQFIKAE